MSGYRFCVNVVTAGFLTAAGSAGWLGFGATAAADPGGGSSSSHDSGGSHSSAGGSHSSGSSQRSSGSGASGSAGSRSGHDSKTSGPAGASPAQHGGGASGSNSGTKSSDSADAAATKPKAPSGPNSVDSPTAAAKQAGSGGGVPTKEKRALTDPKPGTSARVSGVAGEHGVSSVAPAQPPGHSTKVGAHGSADSKTLHPKHIEGHKEGNTARAGADAEQHGNTDSSEHVGTKSEQDTLPSNGGPESHGSQLSPSTKDSAPASNTSGEKTKAAAPGDKSVDAATAKSSPETIQLDSHDLLAMKDYTEWGYIDLNQALRNGTLDASQRVRVDAIKRALEKLPSHEGPVTRGTFLPLEILARYQPDKNVVEDAFTSTTKNPDATFPGNTYFEILSKNGRSVESVSAFPGEAEVLFPPSTAFTVLSKMIDPTTDKTMIRMVER